MTTVETSTCPGAGRYPRLVRRPSRHGGPFTGTCCTCGLAVDLVAHPDGGPGGVVGEHERSTPCR